ncbi:MAG: methyltransferase domain-containing protein [Vicinamibacterales bacterium]
MTSDMAQSMLCVSRTDDSHSVLEQKRLLVDRYLACPVCKGPLRLDERAECLQCGASYPIVNDVLVLLPADADAFAATLRNRYEATVGGTSLPSVFRISKELLGNVSGRAILDVGCSQGDFALKHLVPGGASVVIGVDFAVGAIRVAQQRARALPTVLFVVGDAMALPVQSGRFDRVVVTEVIEHLPDVGACLSELGRALAADGEVILSTPNYFNAVGLFKPIIDKHHHGGRERWTYADHSEELEHFQTPFGVQRQFSDAGLRVLEFRGSDLWMGIRKALMMPWLLLDQVARRVAAMPVWDVLARTPLKYFGVVQYYRLKKPGR